MAEKIAVIVPAHNEAKYISTVLRSLEEWGKINPKNRIIIAVNDGSKDQTRRIAKRFKGVRVIDSKERRPDINVGKAEAVRQGVIHANKLGCSAVVTIDADLKPFPYSHIENLVGELRSSKSEMVIARMDEQGRLDTYSGQRAIDMKALEPWIKGAGSWMEIMKGYGLEIGLNDLVLGKQQNSKITFLPEREPRVGHEYPGRARIDREMMAAVKIAMKRRDALKRLAQVLKKRNERRR